MNKMISYWIIGMLVCSGLGAAVSATHQKQVLLEQSTTNRAPYIDGLDQSMTDFEGTLPIGQVYFGSYVNLTIAQSFIPQKEVLTRTQFLMGRNASTSQPCVLALRDNLTGQNLAVFQLEPSEFPVVNGTPTEEQLEWTDFDFEDIWVTPGQTYYLVVYTNNITGNFYWIAGNGTDVYPNGTVYVSFNDGNTWTELTEGDGCFKTYGLHETFLQITMKSGFLGASFIIKNIGNHTAWDIVLNNTISGGLVLIGKQFTGVIEELPPGQEITLQSGFILGFGKITLTIYVSAANVKQISIEKNATLLLFFLLGIQ